MRVFEVQSLLLFGFDRLLLHDRKSLNGIHLLTLNYGGPIASIGATMCVNGCGTSYIGQIGITKVF